MAGLNPFTKTQIHNKSNVPILLIAYSTHTDGDSKKGFLVREGKEVEIPVGNRFKEVYHRNYNIGNITDTAQICILFRAGHTYDGKNLSSILEKGNAKRVKPTTHDMRLVPSQLFSKKVWNLGLNKEMKVIDMDRNAGQSSKMETTQLSKSNAAASTQNESGLPSLREEVEELKRVVQKLHEKIEALENDWKTVKGKKSTIV